MAHQPFPWKAQGKESKMYSYCKAPSKSGRKCLWFCTRRGRCVRAWDVPIADAETSLPVFRLRDLSSWWSKYSLYSFVGVRHVEIKFLDSKKDGCRFRVIARPFGHEDEVTVLRKRLEATNPFVEPGCCGVDSKGERHPNDERCENYLEDDYGSGCRVKEYISTKNEVRRWMWMPAILDHYWSNDLGEEGLRYLSDRGFLYDYKDLAWDYYGDAEDPYGKSVHALELLSGWHIRRVLWAAFEVIVIDICVVAVAVLASGSVETGLAAGSYVAGVEALVMGLLTLCSAILL